MLRVVLLLLGVAALVWLLRRSFGPPSERNTSDRATQGAPSGKGDELVRCAHCGVHVPRVEAQTQDGRLFCSPEHARLGAGRDRA